MSKLSAEKEIVKLEKKLRKIQNEEIISELRASDVQKLNQHILTLAKQQQDIVTAKANDEELELLLDRKKELEAPYNESLKINKLKARFISLLLKEKE